MKKYFLILIAFLSSQNFCFSSNFNIEPIILNFNGVVAKDSTIIAFADLGSMLISNDLAKSWEQKKVFSGGVIVNTFFDDNKIIAVNNRGQIAESSNKGKDWLVQKELSDSVLAVIQYTDGYFIRMRNKLVTLSKDYEVLHDCLIESAYLSQIGILYKPNYNHSLVYYDNGFVAEFDSSLFIRYDTDLQPLDTLNLLEQINLGDYKSGYRMFYDNDKLYMRYTCFKDGYFQGFVYSSDDFSSVTKFSECNNTLTLYQVLNGVYYSINKTKDDQHLIDSIKQSNRNLYQYFSEFTISGDMQIIVGDRKVIEIFNLKDSTLNVISDYSDLTYWYPPDKINDSTYLFYSSGSSIYTSTDECVTLKPVVDKSSKTYEDFFDQAIIHNRHYDYATKILYLLGESIKTNTGCIWSSDNLGKNFDSTQIDRFSYQSQTPYFRNANINENAQIRGNEVISMSGHHTWNDTIYSTIATFDTQGHSIKIIRSINFIFNYVYSVDTNTYLIHGCDIKDSTSIVAYTSDAGTHWTILKKFPINETIGDVYDIEVNGVKYLALVHYDQTNYPNFTGAFVDVVNKETNEVERIAAWGKNSQPDYGIYGVALTSDGSKAYLSFQDTIFVMDDLFNKNNWDYYLLPEKGRIARPLKKIGDYFYCIYTDNNNPYGSSIYFIKPLDTLITKVNEIEDDNYFYAYPPFPNPASNHVRAKIYWGAVGKVDKENIVVCDVKGNIVSQKDDLAFEKINSYSAYLIWDCSQVSLGLYFICIKINNKTNAIKVIVKK